MREMKGSSADFHSAVSQEFILWKARRCAAAAKIQCPADWKSAIQQIGNLRYVVEPATR
jgi:hypothetical protein